MTVIFARGTTEPGNVGLLTGPAYFDAMEATIGAKALTVKGVEYGATITQFLGGGDPVGSKLMYVPFLDMYACGMMLIY